jgi:hypothetical protein
MYIFQQKFARCAKKCNLEREEEWEREREREQALEPDLNVAMVWELSEQEFKTTMIKMLRSLMEAGKHARLDVESWKFQQGLKMEW